MDMYGPPSTSTSSSSSPVPTAVSEQPCFRIDDLLDLTNVDIVDDSDPHHNYPDPPFIPHHHHLHYNDFNNVVDLCVPSDDAAAELEWLSRFVGGEDDSSSFYAGPILPPSTGSSRPEISADDASLNPRRARSKRSRAPTAKPSRAPAEVAAAARRCAHCLSEKTPQWRTGPAGPKTLCNACGVRFKSGRLVPEYRPAASPTFVLTKHSNSHRKVMELRRQKELSLLSRHHRHHQRQQEGQPPEQDQLYSHHGFRVC